jgi:hypothetical protein
LLVWLFPDLCLRFSCFSQIVHMGWSVVIVSFLRTRSRFFFIFLHFAGSWRGWWWTPEGQNTHRSALGFALSHHAIISFSSPPVSPSWRIFLSALTSCYRKSSRLWSCVFAMLGCRLQGRLGSTRLNLCFPGLPQCQAFFDGCWITMVYDNYGETHKGNATVRKGTVGVLAEPSNITQSSRNTKDNPWFHKQEKEEKIYRQEE